MKWRTIFVVLLLAGMLSCQSSTAASGATADANPYFDAGRTSFDKEDWRSSQKSFELAVREAESGKDKAGLAVALNWLAKSLLKEHRVLAAEEPAVRSVGMFALKPGKGVYLAADSILTLAKIEERLGKFAEAEKLYLQITNNEELEKRPIIRGSALSGLVRIYQETGRSKDASEALDRRRKLPNDSESSSATTLELGKLLIELGNDAAARPLLEPLLKVSSSSPAERIEALLALAGIELAEGNPGEAEDRLTQTIADLKKSTATTAQLIPAYTLLSSALLAQEKSRKALEASQQATSLIEKTFGGKSPLLIDSLRQRAEAYGTIDDYHAAERDYRLILSLEKENLGEASTLLAKDSAALGYLLLMQGKYLSAEDLYKRALEITTKIYGAESAAAATATNNLALLYRNSGDYTKAEQLVRSALEIRKKIYSERSCSTARSMTNLATIMIDQNKADAAEQLLRKAIEIQDQLLTPCHPDLIGTQRVLTELLISREKFSDAEPILRRILSSDESTYGEDSTAVAVDLEKLASVLHGLKREHDYSDIMKRLNSLKDKLTESSGLVLEKLASEAPNSDREIVLPGQPRPAKDKWALVIGISNFKDPSINLKFAAKDATDFRNFLVNEANFKADHVKLLIDESATREKIVANLGESWLRRLANPDDLVLIFVSSHGSPARKDIGGANFIVPYEGTLDNIVLTGIPMQWLTTGIQEAIHCDRVVLMLDICHAGAAGTAGKSLLRTGTDQAPGTGQLVIASSKADQISWESSQYPNGVFTRRLIEGCRMDKGGSLLSKAFQYMRSKVEEEVLRDRANLQTPVIYSKQWRGGDISLSTMPVAPRQSIIEQSPSPPVNKPVPPTLERGIQKAPLKKSTRPVEH